MRRLSLSTVATLVAAAPALSGELPLVRGFYVTADTACGQASMATLTMLRRDGLADARGLCAFEAVAEEAPGRFRVTEHCADLQDPDAAEVTEVVYEQLGEGHFRKTSPYGWTIEARHCPQGDLPEPWRSNDIADLID